MKPNVDSASTRRQAVPTPGFTVRTISGASGGVADVAEVNVNVVAPGYTVDGVARLIAQAPDLLAERDRLLAVNKTLVEALESMVDTHGMHGPCRNHGCSECKQAYAQAQAALKAGKGE